LYFIGTIKPITTFKPLQHLSFITFRQSSNTKNKIMKKVLLSAAFLGLLAIGTVNAQDQDKKTKQDPTKTDQPSDMKKDDSKSQDPNTKQQQMSNDQKQKLDENQKAYDPNQQPANPAPRTDTATIPAQ
jgi:hypothetical protein